MSMDKGLKAGNALSRHRNVLTRDERIAALKDIEKWTEEMGVYGLPKVAHRKMATKKGKDERPLPPPRAPRAPLRPRAPRPLPPPRLPLLPRRLPARAPRPRRAPRSSLGPDPAVDRL